MANYATLKSDIQQYIKQNGNNEITGALLQQELLAMVNSLGANYNYVGIATPSTNPGNPDQNVFYIAWQSGTYSNFNGLTVAENEVAIFKYNGTWTKDVTGLASTERVDELGQYIVDNEFVYLLCDHEHKILLGFRKNGEPFFGVGCPQQVKDYVSEQLGGYNLETYQQVLTFLGTLIYGDKLSDLLGNKIDKDPNKTLIDKEIAESQKIIESDDWIKAITDKNGRLIEGIAANGFKVVFVPIDIVGATIQGKTDDENISLILDKSGRIVGGIKKDGTVYFTKLNGGGKIFDDVDALKDPYGQILSQEKFHLLREWIPYYKGSTRQTYYTGDYYDRCNLLFFTDCHIERYIGENSFSFQNEKDTVDFINNCPVKLDAILQGGDNITPFGQISHAAAMEWAKNYYDVLKKTKRPVCFIRGNHDNNDWLNFPSEVITNEDYNNLWYNFADGYGIVRNPNETNIKVVNGVVQTSTVKSMYHYFDIPDKKIRIIAVDVEDIDRVTTDPDGHCKFYGTTMNYVAQKQMNWIANTALKNLGEGWGVIFVMHQSIWLWMSYFMPNPELTWYGSRSGELGYPIDPPIEDSIHKLFEVAKAFNSQGSYSNVYTYAGQQYNNFYNLNFSCDFSEYSSMTNKPHVICWLMGHEHTDFNTVLDGINLIWTANAADMMAASDDRIVRMAKTPNQNCFDILNIDTQLRKIRMFRYGAGKTCFGVGGNRFLPDGLSY